MGDWNGTVPTILAGDIVTGDDWKSILDELTAISAAWPGYTPIWTTSGTPPFLGNASLGGKFMRVGGFAIAQVNFTAGSTTTFGTSSFQFSLPVANNAALAAVGAAVLLDAGTTRYTASCLVAAGASVATVVVGSNNEVNATGPFTWSGVNNDQLIFQLFYQT
jgi:hypothetical protein